MDEKKLSHNTIDDIKDLEQYIKHLESQLETAEMVIKSMQPIYLMYANKTLDEEKKVEVDDIKLSITHKREPFWE
tara:strand:- start:419 stop:643 length:225 start_codon:yes stop_codon:yes gene_type:complete